MMELGRQKIANFMIDNIRVVVYRLIATLAQIYFQVVKTKNVMLSTVVNVFFDDLERRKDRVSRRGIQDSTWLYATKKSI
jgi:hypothetical protein